MVKAVLPVHPAVIARIMHDTELGGAECRLWLWLCSHAPNGEDITVTLDEMTKGTGLRRQSRVLLTLNVLIEGGYVVVRERQWKLSRLHAVVLRVAATTRTASPADRRVALYSQQ